MRGRLTRDGLSLSQRLHRNHQAVGSELERTLVSEMRAGRSAFDAAEALLEADQPLVALPRYLEELRQAALDAHAAGDGGIYEAAVEKWAAEVEALGQGAAREAGATTLRSATHHLVSELRDARPEQIERAVSRWVLDRAQFQSRVVVRNEMVEAYRDSYRISTAGAPGVVGYRWITSGSHPRADDCDLLAAQNLYGLGAGGYPPDRVPQTPHPMCLCSQTAILDERHFAREAARLRGTPEPPRPWETDTRETAAEWLARQPEGYRLRMLGPTRARAFAAEPTRVIGPAGQVRAVHQVEARPPRTRAPRPVVAARPLVVADRASIGVTLPARPSR